MVESRGSVIRRKSHIAAALTPYSLGVSSAGLVCLLDDDSSILIGMSRLLSSAGFTTERFSDPQMFLRHAKISRPPVAVIDVWMPLMNGLEVQSQLRDISPSTRVIVFTGKDDDLVRTTALDAGACAFFVKPIDDEQFLTAVRLALSGR